MTTFRRTRIEQIRKHYGCTKAEAIEQFRYEQTLTQEERQAIYDKENE